MEKIIKFGEKEVKMRASAMLPRLYRSKFGRDMIVDISKLQKDFEKNKKNGDDLPITSLELFENIAWLMAYVADKENTPETPEKWLDGIEGLFSIYEIFPQIMELWELNTMTTSIPKKK